MVSLANSLHDLARKVARMDMKALEAGMREGEVVSGLRPLPGTWTVKPCDRGFRDVMVQAASAEVAHGT